jgi:hypothetical protein
VHGEKYYVSFVDAYSRFTWVYLLRQKSDVFTTFHHFQHKVERTLDKKTKLFRQIEVGNITSSIHFSRIYALVIECHVLTPISRTVLQRENITI